ncbi:MAG: hypothetical protein OXG72_04265 [Acidobacteria bacterium]|nr:hypothetical protein [Acidobacteriota bacterium]
MFDTLSVARELTATGMQREQADVLANAIGRAAVHGDHVTPETLRETLRAETAALELRLIKWIIGTGVAVTGAVVGLLRLIG